MGQQNRQCAKQKAEDITHSQEITDFRLAWEALNSVYGTICTSRYPDGPKANHLSQKANAVCEKLSIPHVRCHAGVI